MIIPIVFMQNQDHSQRILEGNLKVVDEIHNELGEDEFPGSTSVIEMEVS